jgi:hypothetical protein
MRSFLYVLIGLICAVFFFWLLLGPGYVACAVHTSLMLAGPIFQCIVLLRLGALTVILAMLFVFVGAMSLSKVNMNMSVWFSIILAVFAFWYLLFHGLLLMAICVVLAALLFLYLLYED